MNYFESGFSLLNNVKRSASSKIDAEAIEILVSAISSFFA